MQSRRHEDFAVQSSAVRGRKNADFGPDSYLMMPPHSKKSLSPRRMGEPSYLQRGHRSTSLERRRVADNGSRRIRSRSPPYSGVQRGGPVYDDKRFVDKDPPLSELHRRYGFLNHMDMNHGDDASRTRIEFGYKHGRAIIDDKFEGSRLGDAHGGMPVMVGQKSAVMEEIAGAYKSTVNVGPISRYDGRGENFSSASLNMGRVRYPDVQDSYLLDKDKHTAREQFEEGGKNTIFRRGSPFSNLTAPKSNESMVSRFRDHASRSPENSRVNRLGDQGGEHLLQEDHRRSSANIPEPLCHSRYGQRQLLDINEDVARYGRETFSPLRTGHLDSLRQKPWIREGDDSIYPSVDIYEKMNLREGVDHRDMIRPIRRDPITDQMGITEFARGNLRNSSLWDHHSLGKPISSSRSPAEQRDGGHNLDSVSVHSRLGRKISSEQEMPYMDMVQRREPERMRIDYDLEQDVWPGSRKERIRSPPGFLYDTERPNLAERTHKLQRDDYVPHDSSSRILKRKYTVDEEENRFTSRTIMSRLDRRHGESYGSEGLIDQDARAPTFTKRRGYTHGFSRRADDAYDATNPAFEDHEELMHNHPTKSYKYDNHKNAKGSARFGAPDLHNPSHQNKKYVLPKGKNVWIRGEDDNKVEQYEDRVSSAKPEPPEGSEEFKKLVHDLFLSFTKKLNDTPSARRRYLEQGRAGSLFCIVCGRSESKEFMDTQRLGTHAFMCHKVGLRAQHLGLHKAICVLLGWNATVPPETITWFPDTLSKAKTWAQKEDLILWPPLIVIHNTSISHLDSDGQGPATVEALGQFLRGKGFTSGKVKLGKPANGSIMLVKFVGTFSALHDAEKIHEYFANNKHGRKDFNKINPSKGKSVINREKTNGDEVNEIDLFGYMGIAEDLDKVDVDTKRKCLIKSKKDIQELVDAPVKPE